MKAAGILAGMVFVLQASLFAQPGITYGDGIERTVISNVEITQSKNNRGTGYFNHIGLETLSADGNTTLRPFVINGYRFTSRLSAGIGVGFTPYNDPLALIPVFLDLNYRFIESGIFPFVYLRGGHSFSIHSDDR
ncbi:MAG: hypothetical protein ACFCU6_03665, partial [Balneolaceae bacterium]